MIKRFVKDIAAQISVQLSSVSVIEAQYIGCLDVYLLKLTAGDQQVNALVHQFELDELQSTGCEGLEIRIRAALSRLQMLVEA